MTRLSFRSDMTNLLSLIAFSPRSTKVQLVGGIASIGIQAGLLVGSARALGALLEIGFVEKDIARGALWLVVTVVLQLLSLCFLMQGRKALSQGAWGVTQAIRRVLLAKVPVLSFRTLDQSQIGNIVGTLTSELDSLDSKLRDALVRLGQTAIHVCFILLAGFALSPSLALVLVIGVVPAWLFSAPLRKHIRAAQVVLSESEAGVHTLVAEFGGARETLLGMGSMPWARQRLGSAEALAYRGGLGAARWEALSTGVLSLVSYFPLVLMTGFTLVSFGGDPYPLALVITFIRLGQQIVFPIEALALETQGLQTVFRSTDRIRAFLELGEEQEVTSKEIGPLERDIRFECVSLSYGGEETLRSVSLIARRGEIIGIEGASGSGKSTLMGALLRQYSYQCGEILWDGVSIKKFSFRSIRNAVSFGFGEPLILRDTLLENLTMGKTVGEDRLGEISRLCGLTRLQKEKGIRLSDILEPASLSPGEKQSIQLVRLALSTSRVTILDEALSSLDPDVEREVLGNIRILFPTRVVFLINHRQLGLEVCDRVYRFESGRLKERALSAPKEIGIPTVST